MKRTPNFQKIRDTVLKELEAQRMKCLVGKNLLGHKEYSLQVEWDNEDDENTYKWNRVENANDYPRPIRFLIDFLILSDLATWEEAEDIDKNGNYRILRNLGHDVDYCGDEIVMDVRFQTDLNLETMSSYEECMMRIDLLGVRGVTRGERKLIGFLTWLLRKGQAANKGK